MEKNRRLRVLRYVLAVLLAAWLIAGCGRGAEYLQTSMHHEEYAQVQSEFNRMFEVSYIRGSDGSITDAIDSEVSDDSVEGVLQWRDRVIDKLRSELRSQGKIAWVIQPTWSKRGREITAPEPWIVIFY